MTTDRDKMRKRKRWAAF